VLVRAGLTLRARKATQALARLFGSAGEQVRQAYEKKCDRRERGREGHIDRERKEENRMTRPS
jgi:hypothetical protein